MAVRKVIIAGAGGRDFHNFNTSFKDNPDYKVVCFTATQIPNIDDRRYPQELAGKLYPDGIPIYDQAELPKLIVDYHVDEVVFSYSDVSHQTVMELGSQIMAVGADFRMMGTTATMISTKVPLISICAVRTGCGKSQTTRYISELLNKAGKKVVAIRHPMPYGDLAKQAVQRFSHLTDLDAHECTIEEREEYEPHIMAGNIVYSGCDYQAILDEAQKEADIILWDGGNNDFSFYRPDLEIVVADPHRVGHELTYYPGLLNLIRAQVVVINKVQTANPDDVAELHTHIRSVNSEATIIEADSPLVVDDPAALENCRALIIEDGPTLTHGNMTYGAGLLAARQHGAVPVNPRPFAVGVYREVFKKYPHLREVLPAIGYGDQQIADLEATIRAVDCEVVVIGTPIDLRRMIKIDKPTVRVTYELRERPGKSLLDVLTERNLV